MLNILRKSLGRWRQLRSRNEMIRKVKDRDWANELIKLRIPVNEVSIRSGHDVYFHRLGVELSYHITSFEILKQYSRLVELVEKCDAKLICTAENSELVAHIGEEKYAIHLGEEVYILYEIFVRGDYDLKISGKALLIDIGANVGFTTIFLAAKNPGLAIWAYEPLVKNYLRAKNNLELNAHLGNPIQLHNYGLSTSDAEVEIQSVANNPGRSSIVIDRTTDPTGEVNKQQVAVQNAGRVVGDIIQKNQKKDIWIKMDCEGSEYSIIESLVSAGVLEGIKGIILEWHVVGKNKEQLIRLNEVLREHGFNIHVRSELDNSAVDGMCLAVR